MSSDESVAPPAEASAEMSTLAEEPPPATQEVRAPPAEASRRFPIIAIGASAGGLEAIEHLVKHLQPCGAAFLILQHLSPRYASSLPEILGRSANLPVVSMIDGAVVSPDTIYTAPPGVEVRVHAGALQLRPLAESARQHPI